MKHITEICKHCGSQTRGLVYERALLDKTDIERIKICNICKSEYFVYDDLDNSEDKILAENLFRKVYQRVGLEEDQALSIAKRMFINQMKIR
ncbi:hypothetical protein KKA14_16980 [bacterium]|nr:hypothetical protein [bacterium]